MASGLLLTVPRAFRTAVVALVRHPLRAALTGFGVLFGVLSVTLVIALGEGAERSVEKSVESLGENVLTVRPRVPESTTQVAREAAPRLSVSDARALGREVRGIAESVPVLETMVRAVAGARNQSAQALGVTREYLVARRYRVTEGTEWDETHERLGARVCLLGSSLARTLFPGEEAAGKSIRLGKQLFRVLGVLSEKGQTPFGMDQDNVVVLPLFTVRSKLIAGRADDVSQIFVTTRPGFDGASVSRAIGQVLRERHALAVDAEDAFDIRDQAKMAEGQRAIVGVMRTLLLVLAALTLVIGGIGVMNIMMVSVTERSREIGTRLSIGARSFDILAQFLIEATLLSLLGGAIGVLGAAALLSPLEAYFGFSLGISEAALSVSVGTSLALGLFFGFLPARRAALMDPVAALRKD